MTTKKENMFPSVLFKAFTCREHAEVFCKGSVRFSTLEHYKNIEDIDRADSTEGSGEVQRIGEELIIDVKNEFIHSRKGVENLHVSANARERFICCFSYSGDDNYKNLPRKFGNYYVKVHSPENLFYDLEAAVNSDDGLQQNPPTLEAGYVRYDKEAYVGEMADRKKAKDLAWLQKPISNSEENEYRYQFWFCFHELIVSPEHYFIIIGKALDYCEVIEAE